MTWNGVFGPREGDELDEGGFAYSLGFLVRRAGPAWVRRIMYGSGVAAIVIGAMWIIGSWPA